MAIYCLEEITVLNLLLSCYRSIQLSKYFLEYTCGLKVSSILQDVAFLEKLEMFTHI